MTHGPNFNRLVTHKMVLDAVPPGGGIASALKFLTEPGRISQSAKDATAWVEAAVAVVKTAPDNPYGDDDEAICGELLRKVEERKSEQRRARRPAPGGKP